MPQIHVGARYDFKNLFCAVELGTDLRKHNRQRSHNQSAHDLEPFVMKQSRERSISLLFKFGYRCSDFAAYVIGGMWSVKDIYSVSFVDRDYSYGDVSYSKTGIKPIYGLGVSYDLSNHCSIYLDVVAKRIPGFCVICPGVNWLDEDNSNRRYASKGRNQIDIRLGLNMRLNLK